MHRDRINGCPGQHRRFGVQLVMTVLFNGYLKGFSGERIYSGNLKSLCVPVLNCYACPGALGSCPVGALQTVIGGGIYLDSCIAGSVDRGKKSMDPLSPREREVLLLSSKGFPVKEVATKLAITERTVQAHLSSVYTKFGAKNKTEALIIALKNGILYIDELLEGELPS